MTAATRPRRRVPWWLWVVLGAGALVGGLAALGGFDEVPVQKLPEIELGERFTGNELAVQIDDIRLSPTAPVTGYDAGDGKVYLVVEATLENVTTAPNIFQSRAVRVLVDGVISGNDAPYHVVELRSGDGLSFTQPGLPTRVAYLWQVDASRIDVGDDIIVGIFERYDAPDDPRFDDAKTSPVVVVRLLETIGGSR